MFLVLKMKGFGISFYIMIAAFSFLTLNKFNLSFKTVQVTNLKNEEVTVNSKPQTPEKIGFSKTLKNPKP